MYRTAKLDMPVEFRSGFNHYMAGISSTIELCIQKRGDKCEVGKFRCPYPPEGEYAMLCTTRPSLKMFFPGPSLICNVTWVENCVFSQVKHIDWRDDFLIKKFT